MPRRALTALRRTAGRAVGAAVLLLVLSVVVFLLPQLTGVDEGRAVIRSRTAEAAPDAATVARLTHELGLDRPLPERYLAFLGRLVTGDLGTSFTSRRPVAPQVGSALVVSVELVAGALLVALLVGTVVGTLSAARPGGFGDRLATLTSRLTVAVPEFVLAPVLVLVVSVRLGLLPAVGWGTPGRAVLPVVTVAAFPTALVAQLVRTELLDVLTRPWVLAARTRGVRERTILRHALRSAYGSVTALAVVFVPGLLGGAVVVEVVFAVPGLGRLVYESIGSADLPVTQAGLMAVLAVAVVTSLVGDVVRRLVDPTLGLRTAA